MASHLLAELTDPLIAKALAEQGFAGREIVARWPEIVGERLAPHTRPLRIDWPKRRPAPGEPAGGETAVLVLRVEGAFALDVQQLGPVLLARVNAHLGWNAVGRIVIRQGPVDAPARAAGPRPPPPVPDAVRQAAEAVQDEALADALKRLGAAVHARKASRDEG